MPHFSSNFTASGKKLWITESGQYSQEQKHLHFWHCYPILLQFMALQAAIWFADLGKGTGIWYPLQGLMIHSFWKKPLFLKIAFINLNIFSPKYMTRILTQNYGKQWIQTPKIRTVNAFLSQYHLVFSLVIQEIKEKLYFCLFNPCRKDKEKQNLLYKLTTMYVQAFL